MLNKLPLSLYPELVCSVCISLLKSNTWSDIFPSPNISANCENVLIASGVCPILPSKSPVRFGFQGPFCLYVIKLHMTTTNTLFLKECGREFRTTLETEGVPLQVSIYCPYL
jgi:hypothetical protein